MKPITPLGSGLPLAGTSMSPIKPVDLGGESSFLKTLQDVISQVSDVQGEARDVTEAFLRGEDVELHQLMATVEEANLSLEFLVELRNKFADAYRALINLQ